MDGISYKIRDRKHQFRQKDLGGGMIYLVASVNEKNNQMTGQKLDQNSLQTENHYQAIIITRFALG